MDDFVTFNSDPTAWRLHRLNVGSIDVATPDGLIAPSVNTPMPPEWRFARNVKVTRDPRHPQFRRYKNQSMVMSSDTAAQSFLDAGDRAVAALDLPNPDDLDPSVIHDDVTLIRATEYASWKKLTLQLGTLPSWHLDLPSPKAPTPKALAAFRAACRAILEVYASAHSAFGEYAPDPPPSSTVGGWPSFQSGPPAKVLSSCFAPRSAKFHTWIEECMEWSSVSGLPDLSSLAYGLGGRSGPLKKAQNLWFVNDKGAWEPYAKIRGVSQRNRIVYMASAGLNVALWPLYARLKGCQIHIPGLWRDGRDEARLRGWPYRYEADVSGFDTSISFEIFEVVADEISRAFPDMAHFAYNWRRAEFLPLITPSTDPTADGECGIRFSEGGLKSGLILTSSMGTLIQSSLVLMSLRAQGVTPSEVSVCVHGDDVAIGCSAPLSAEAWTESYAGMGMDCALVPGVGFLSRHITKDGRSLPIGGRIVQQSCSNEHEPTGGEWVIGLLMLGLTSRCEGSSFLPSDVKDAVNHMLAIPEWIRPYHGSSLDDTLSNVRSIMDPFVMKALRKRRGLAWLQEQLRTREHSPIGRSLARAFPSLITSLGGVDAEMFALSVRVNSLPWHERKELATMGFEMIYTDDSALRWLSTVKERMDYGYSE